MLYEKKLLTIVKTFAITAMVSMVLVRGNISAEEINELDSEISLFSSDLTLTRNTTVQVYPSIEKTSPTGSSAQITLYTKISSSDLVSFYVKNEQGDIVSQDSANFTNTNATSYKQIPYRIQNGINQGIKGQRYFLMASLSQSSVSSTLSVSYNFMP